jgi:mannose-6-phosphate isomerase-like protein (cupin superfamily)
MGENRAELSRYDENPAYVTRDGSVIRELMHPAVHGNVAQSLAEARVPEGSRTLAHRHPRAEELYHFTAGQGEMVLGDATFKVRAGDTVRIAPGTVHRVCNTGQGDLVILCCCSPAYSHEDTELVEDM